MILIAIKIYSDVPIFPIVSLFFQFVILYLLNVHFVLFINLFLFFYIISYFVLKSHFQYFLKILASLVIFSRFIQNQFLWLLVKRTFSFFPNFDSNMAHFPNFSKPNSSNFSPAEAIYISSWQKTWEEGTNLPQAIWLPRFLFQICFLVFHIWAQAYPIFGHIFHIIFLLHITSIITNPMRIILNCVNSGGGYFYKGKCPLGW